MHGGNNTCMPRKTVVGICGDCGKEGPLFDVKNKRCGSCAGKRGGGRPKAIKVTKKPFPGSESGPSDPDRSIGARYTRNPPEEEKGTPGPQGSPSSGGGCEYHCDSCGARLEYGQRKCPGCGIWNDWRGTSVEQDSDLVVCPECGAICGHADTATKCPRCNYLG